MSDHPRDHRLLLGTSGPRHLVKSTQFRLDLVPRYSQGLGQGQARRAWRRSHGEKSWLGGGVFKVLV